KNMVYEFTFGNGLARSYAITYRNDWFLTFLKGIFLKIDELFGKCHIVVLIEFFPNVFKREPDILVTNLFHCSGNRSFLIKIFRIIHIGKGRPIKGIPMG